MRRLPTLVVLALTALPALVGCGGGPPRATAVDTAAITLAVDGVVKAFDAALAAKDTAAIDSLYAADAAVLPEHHLRVDGRAAVHRLWAGALAVPDCRLVLAPGHTTVSEAGDLAVLVGTYVYDAPGPRGVRLHDTGKFVTVLAPVGGAWKIVVDTWNSDLPPAGPAQ